MPFPYFQEMTELTYFPFLSGLTTVIMGCSIPVVDYYYCQYMQQQRRQRTRTSTEDGENRSFWESDQWSMPMRYLGGVVGFAWAASVPLPCALLHCPRPLNCLLSCYFDADDQRLNWTSQVQLYAVIALAALALWFLFDRTWLGLSVSSAVGIGSWLGFMLVITS